MSHDAPIQPLGHQKLRRGIQPKHWSRVKKTGKTVKAGKPPPSGATAKDCLQEPPQPPTPPEVRKFAVRLRPEPGASRVHHGKAGDPDVASALVHGVSTKASLNSSSVLNPPRGSVLQQKLQELSEAAYRSHRRAPLGRSAAQTSGLPTGVDPRTAVFGVKNSRGMDVRELLNPPKSRAEVEREAQEAHQLYVQSHNHYFVGERIHRKYDLPHFRVDSVFGLPTPHFNDGRSLAQTLHWHRPSRMSEGPGLTGTDDDTHPASNNMNKLKEPSSSPSNEKTFGILPPQDQYGAGEVIHQTGPGHFNHGPAPQRSLVNAVRHHLKKINFHFFPSLLRAFSHYDKKGRGLIDRSDLEEVCHEFRLNTNEEVLQELLDNCDLDRDGGLSFMEFSNFLCWKDLMPITVQDQKILTGHPQPQCEACPPSESEEARPRALLRPQDLEPLEPGSSLRVPRTLTRTRGDAEAFSPSSALIGAVTDPAVGKELRSCGVPSIRSDLPAPRLRRVSDRTNYGDTSTAAALLRPHVHAALGVHEEHFLSARSRKEIAEIFQNVGVELPEPLFDEAWTLASMRSPSGNVCVESFRSALKEIKAM